MTKISARLLFFLPVMTLAACAHVNPTSVINDVSGLKIYSDDGEKGFVFISDESNTQKFCMSPTPDAVAESGAGITLRVPELKTTDGLQEASSIGAVSLGGRSTDVLLAREFLYRACEFSVNNQLTKQEAQTFYQLNLDLLKVVLTANSSNGVAGFSSPQNCGASGCTASLDTSTTSTSDTEDEDDDDDQ